MTTAGAEVRLSEWSVVGPADLDILKGRFLDQPPSAKPAADLLRLSNLMGLTELREGLEVRTFSHVGRVRIGDLTITVLPKLRGTSFLRLLRYAYGLRRLHLIAEVGHSVEPLGFEDLLIIQLIAEAQELLARGLERSYVEHQERLPSPRGRLDVQKLALGGEIVSAALPCRHYRRTENTLLNQVLLAGLHLAATITRSLPLRREVERLARIIEGEASPVPLNAWIMTQVQHQLTRLTRSYAPAMRVIGLLLEAQGVSLDEESTWLPLPGFLFDMNRFFQELLSRFLRENLPGYLVRDEKALVGMMRYHPGFNPRRRRAPAPRPDYVVLRNGSTQTILDAKYRDLWEKSLPRDMLYQLVMYAISNPERPESTILYPTPNPMAREERLDVAHPLTRIPIGRVCLRPVSLDLLETLVDDGTRRGQDRRQSYASRLAFGES